MNRAFIYGDLLFETIKVSQGSPVFAHAHYDRLIAGASLLKYDVKLSFKEFVKALTDAVAQTNLTDARARFVLHRNGGGFYTPVDSSTRFFVDVFPLTEIRKDLNIGVYTDNYKPCNELSTVKSGNALLYTMAGIWAKENGLDDAIILNEHGCVCEATSSNIFLVKENKVFTPPLSEGCVAGIMRSHILSVLRQQQYVVHESLVTIEQLKEADAVFLTNAISGVVNVTRFEDTTYHLQFTI